LEDLGKEAQRDWRWLS